MKAVLPLWSRYCRNLHWLGCSAFVLAVRSVSAEPASGVELASDPPPVAQADANRADDGASSVKPRVRASKRARPVETWALEGPEYGPPAASAPGQVVPSLPPSVPSLASASASSAAAPAAAVSAVVVATSQPTPAAVATSQPTTAPLPQPSAPTAASGAGVAAAQPSAPKARAALPEARSSLPTGASKPFEVTEIRVRDVLVLKLKLGDGGLSPKERAIRATQAIEAALAAASIESVRTELREERALLFVGARPIVELTRADAEAMGEGSLELYAASAAAKIRDLLESERRRGAIAGTMFNVVGVGALALLVFYVIRLLGSLARKAQAFVNLHPERVPAIRLRSIEVVGPAVLRSSIIVGVGVTKFLLQFALAYTWLVFSSSLFDATRGFAARLTALLLVPLGELMTRFAALVPLMLVTAIAVVVLVVLVRFVELFFGGVERRETELGWLRPELARPTSLLIRGGIILASLLFVAPVVTGNLEGALSRLGLLFVVTCAVAATPLLASGVVGLVTLYGSRLSEGDYLRVGSGEGACAGRVQSIGLFEITLEDDGGQLTRVSHLLTLVRPLAIASGKSAQAALLIEAEAEPEQFLRLLDELASEPAFNAEAQLLRLTGDRCVGELRFAAARTLDRRTLLLEVNQRCKKAKIAVILAEWRRDR